MSESYDTQAAVAFVPPSAGLLPRRMSTLLMKSARKEETKFHLKIPLIYLALKLPLCQNSEYSLIIQ
jgi:hypothetical protein